MELAVWIYVILISFVNADVIQLTNDNIKTVLDDNELVLVDFYANWCYFSNLLDPIFTEASNKLNEIFKDKGKILLAKIDCDDQPDLAKHYHIQKYPTIKIFRFGQICKREYRGARNVDAFVEYIRSELVDPIKKIEPNSVIAKELGKSYIIGHFKNTSGHNYELFKAVAYQLGDSCNLHLQIIPDIPVEKLTYESFATEPIVLTDLSDQEQTRQWIIKFCTPFVRNITFQNAEDIIEEGKPLVLLFYDRNDEIITSSYFKFITDHMQKESESVNFVYADGDTFAHPLAHLGKTKQDLPLIAIDSFKHMFVLSTRVEDALMDPNILKNFIADLHSEKLHRDFHNPPKSLPGSVEPEQPPKETANDNSENHKHAETAPVTSIFKKLRPNPNRYTLFHDEF